MAKIIGLPKLSPTMEEGTLAAWVKKEGDKVEIDDLLAEVETDKATMEFRSFDKGVLLKILAPEGETLAPDAPVAIIGKAGEDISGLIEKAGTKAAASTTANTNRVVDGDVADGDVADGAVGFANDSHIEKSDGRSDVNVGSGVSDGRLLTSPLVRKIAREKNIDLSTIEGTGPRGRIIKRDLESIAAGNQPMSKSASFAANSGTFERQPPRVEKASQMRKAIARTLTASKQNTPHYYLTLDAHMDALWAARKRVNTMLEKSGDKVSVNDFIIKACAAALRQVPEVNASWLDGQIAYHQVVDISVAVAIPDGLITPVVRDADRKGVLEISNEVRTLAQRARDKKLQPEEFTNGTFSVSNLGMFGIDEFSAVINPPEGAILAVGAVRDEPIVHDGAIQPGKKMRATLSCDHRVIDGAVGAQFCKVLKQMLEEPTAMLI